VVRRSLPAGHAQRNEKRSRQLGVPDVSKNSFRQEFFGVVSRVARFYLWEEHEKSDREPIYQDGQSSPIGNFSPDAVENRLLLIDAFMKGRGDHEIVKRDVDPKEKYSDFLAIIFVIFPYEIWNPPQRKQYDQQGRKNSDERKNGFASLTRLTTSKKNTDSSKIAAYSKTPCMLLLKEKNSGHGFHLFQKNTENIHIYRSKTTQLFFLPEAYTSFCLTFRQAANLEL